MNKQAHAESGVEVGVVKVRRELQLEECIALLADMNSLLPFLSYYSHREAGQVVVF